MSGRRIGKIGSVAQKRGCHGYADIAPRKCKWHRLINTAQVILLRTLQPLHCSERGALCTFWRSLSDDALKKACVLSQEVRKAQRPLAQPSLRDRKWQSDTEQERRKKNLTDRLSATGRRELSHISAQFDLLSKGHCLMRQRLTSLGNDVSWFLSQLKLESCFNFPILRGKLWSKKHTHKHKNTDLENHQVLFWFSFEKSSEIYTWFCSHLSMNHSELKAWHLIHQQQHQSYWIYR